MSKCIFFFLSFFLSFFFALIQSWSSLYPCVPQLYPPKCWPKSVDEKDFVSKRLSLGSSGLGPGRLVYKQKVIVIFLAMKRQLDSRGKFFNLVIVFVLIIGPYRISSLTNATIKCKTILVETLSLIKMVSNPKNC
jgi:hypothetical protein